MDKIIEQIVAGKGVNATNEIAKSLNKKLSAAIKEQKIATAKKSFGTFAELLKTNKQANGAMKEDEGSRAGIESRISLYRKQIQTNGDPGGVRRAAIKKLEAQLGK